MTAPLGDAAAAAAWLESLIVDPPRPYAERAARAQQAVRALLAALDGPQRGLPVIHITGSKGKGSTALLLEALLRAAGLRVGTFTSPHLEHWRERFRLDGEPLDEIRFAALMERVRPPVERLRRDGIGCSFFDTATAAALWLFREEAVDAAVVEVGLGGRLDATNVVEPRVTCLTGVELEHADKLGPTLADIAGHKAGIVKPGIPLVSGPLPPAAETVVAAAVREQGAPWWRLEHEIRIDWQPGRLRYAAPELSLETPLGPAGRHQAINAALALACAQRFGVESLPRIAARALADLQLPGRGEILSRRPWIVIDGAHTVESARALRSLLDTLPAGPRHWLLSFTHGKDPRPFVAELLGSGDRVILTRADPGRSRSPAEIAALLQEWRPNLHAKTVTEPAAALEQALDGLEPDALLCLTGSVYLAGLGRRLLRKNTDARSGPAGRR